MDIPQKEISESTLIMVNSDIYGHAMTFYLSIDINNKIVTVKAQDLPFLQIILLQKKKMELKYLINMY